MADEITPGEAGKALGKLGASKGGKARAEKLTPERRKEIAQKAIQARWAKAKEGHIPTAVHGTPDHPLRIGDIEIPCFVLDDSRRVLIQKGMIDALDMKQGTAAKGEGDRLAKFIATKSVNPFVPKDLADLIIEPILFKTPSGSLAYGYEATVLADLCEAVLKSRRDGKPNYQQKHIAKRCEILMSGFARVGIIALVDEATGYQYFRERAALGRILEEYIAKELVAWESTFPQEFYENMFRLKGWTFRPESSKRPMLLATMTLDLVYKRLAPGVLEELHKRSPKDQKGRRKNALHQWLSGEVGYPKLKEHFAALRSLWRLTDNYEVFHSMVDRALPAFNETMILPFPVDDDE